MPHTITSRLFGVLPQGDAVQAFTLPAPNGIEAEALTYGATLSRLLVPDSRGVLANVVLGFSTLEDYLRPHPYFDATVGHVAGRIPGAAFPLGGEEYPLHERWGQSSAWRSGRFQPQGVES